MLIVSNIKASYGKVGVLWDVSLRVEAKEVIALVGANAAGKTTMLNTISGLIHPAAGSLEFLGMRIDGFPPYRIAKMGICHVPEGGKLFPDMTVLENLEMGA
jgi:branched-chain amino acid transport system ATP-binding protein